ncbi:MAG TPA: hypothetical protein VIK04_14825, partial [Solirubrobacteraceae bacterium]
MSDTSSPAPPSAEPAAAPPGERTTGLPSRWSPVELGERYGILVLWGVVIIVFSLLRPNTFATSANFETIFGTQAVQLVITLGLI